MGLAEALERGHVGLAEDVRVVDANRVVERARRVLVQDVEVEAQAERDLRTDGVPFAVTDVPLEVVTVDVPPSL